MNDLAQQNLDIQKGIQALGISPKSALGSFLERARINGARRTLDAAQQYLNSVAALHQTAVSVRVAMRDHRRAIEEGLDIDSILQGDRNQRRVNLINSQKALQEAEMDAWEVDDRYQATKAARSGRRGTPAEPPGDQAAQEFQADFQREAAAAQARHQTDRIVADFLKNHGDTPQNREAAANLRTHLETFINEMAA